MLLRNLVQCWPQSSSLFRWVLGRCGGHALNCEPARVAKSRDLRVVQLRSVGRFRRGKGAFKHSVGTLNVLTWVAQKKSSVSSCSSLKEEMGDYCTPSRGITEIMPPEGHIMPPEGCIVPPEGCRRPEVEAARGRHNATRGQHNVSRGLHNFR